MRPRRSRSYWLRPSSPVEGGMASACAAAAAALARCTGSARARAPLDRSMPAAPGRAVVGDSGDARRLCCWRPRSWPTRARELLAVRRDVGPAAGLGARRGQAGWRPLLWAAAAASITGGYACKAIQRRMMKEFRVLGAAVQGRAARIHRWARDRLALISPAESPRFPPTVPGFTGGGTQAHARSDPVGTSSWLGAIRG